MAALATLDDLAAVTQGPVADPQTAERLLGMASAAVRRWCRRTFDYVEDHEVTVYARDGRLTLPNGPVEAVASLVNPDGVSVAAAGYDLAGTEVTRCGWWSPGAYTVTYTHGYDPIPEDVALAVCLVVNDFITGPGGPITAEAIGEASYSYAPGSGAMTVGAAAQRLLVSYRTSGGWQTVEMRR